MEVRQGKVADGTDLDRLRALGAGVPIDEICRAASMDRPAFDRWWQAVCATRLPELDGVRHVGVEASVQILRDSRGVPHIFAASDADLFFGYGYAMAQDRLFQMDLRRRRGQGRLAEVLGADALEADILARTTGLHLHARAELERLSAAHRALVEAFARGVNAWLDACAGNLPVEFELLGYAPEPWSAYDSASCTVSWRWQLNGRPWVISVPELARQTLPDPDLYRVFIEFQREADEVTIVPAGAYSAVRDGLLDLGEAGELAGIARLAGVSDTAPAADRRERPFAGREQREAPRAAAMRPEEAGGSNDWVVAGSRTASGLPMLASDPHMPYESASSFYEVHLSGGSFEAAGAGFVGMPGLTFGRNRHLAWGITNNICSQRDLYREPPEATIAVRDEVISVRDAESHRLEVQVTRHGPIVDHLLPPAAAPEGPVAMRWVGALDCDWFSAQLRLDRSASVDEAMRAVRGWLAPTFSLVLADDAGHIGYLATGSVPVRGRAERGYRDATNPADGWLGLIPFASMPQVVDPARGWISTANNRPAPEDFPYPLAGTWDEGYRARRIGQLIETTAPHDRRTFGRIHTDTWSERALGYREALLVALDGRVAPEDLPALEVLRDWDFRLAADSAGAAIWEVMLARWSQTVAAERFPDASADYVATSMRGLSARLMVADSAGWFRPDGPGRLQRLAECFHAALDELRVALGDDPRAWRWGALHHLVHRHPLSGRGDLGSLLDKPAREVGGGNATVNSSGLAGSRADPRSPTYLRAWEATSGAGYRLVADLGDPDGSIWTVTAEGQSANAGSPYAADQLDDFVTGRYHELPLDRARAETAARHRLSLTPDDGTHD